MTIGPAEDARASIHERRRRIVAHEMPCELRGDESRRGRGASENIEYVLAVLHSAPCGQRVPKDNLLTRVMLLRTKDESAAELRCFDAPSGESPRDFLHVLLRVSAVNAERV